MVVATVGETMSWLKHGGRGRMAHEKMCHTRDEKQREEKDGQLVKIVMELAVL